jgi:hypothetical protein
MAYAFVAPLACGAFFCSLMPLLAQNIQLQLPLDCTVGSTCLVQNYVDRDPSQQAKDYTCGSLTYDGHNGTDFRLLNLAAMRRGVDVLAAAPGRVVRVRDGMDDVSIRAVDAPTVANRECGNGAVLVHAGNFETQYCHMRKGSLRVHPDDQVAARQIIGQVGLSGMTEFPHLHLTVRHNGKVVDPFAFDTAPEKCQGGASLWDPTLRDALRYREREVLNYGFAPRPISMEDVESGENLPALPTSDAFVAFVRVVGLKAGDRERLIINMPSGEVLADSKDRAVESNKAQGLLFSGRKRREVLWPLGRYEAYYSLTAVDRIVLEKRFHVQMQ